ncbi:carbohydrate ABC transporter permease [Shinella granuli]|jgi:trehalose/maltose transport system permease protein|uniref:Trehalose/maltose transport system permease protein n=1 Tax=Shinella granuli TaxID=323621 RepID=A0A4R2D3U0_SHIGR|nr:carbohydrate ABC transporter permease [Shinella granuli]TCN45999.1 trehalose/maltose transport system permease protein [Shinella granuli]
MVRSATGRRLHRIAIYGLFAVVALYTLFPFYWMIASSLKSGQAIFDVTFLPDLKFNNYEAILSDGVFLRSLLNSLVVAASVVALSLGLAIAAAYALGRIDFRGRSPIMFLFLAVSMFPQIALLSGLFEMIRWLGLYNTLGSLIFAYMIFTLPFNIWVLTTFMRSLPRQIEEAAIMDGCSPLRIVRCIFLPMMGPALISTGLLAFIASWNEFLFALTFILTDENRTVPVAIALISGSSRYEFPYGAIMAASTIVTVPLIVMALLFQKYIVSGLTAGAVKG